MKYISIVICLMAVTPNLTLGQKQDDNLIIVTVADTNKLYERVRQAISFSDFIIKEDSGRDTLRTAAERIGRTYESCAT